MSEIASQVLSIEANEKWTQCQGRKQVTVLIFEERVFLMGLGKFIVLAPRNCNSKHLEKSGINFALI